MNFKCNDIKKLVVKIKYLNSQSTGVILRPKNKTDYFFILITKHSLKTDDEESFEDVEIVKVDLEKIIITYDDDNHSFQPLKIIDTSNDLVVLIIESSFCIDNKIQNLKILKTEFEFCGFAGYANISANRLKCFNECTHTIDHDEMVFEIDSNKTLQSSNKDEILATIGLSGSGLFTLVNNNEYMFVGVVSNTVTHNNSFDCVNLSYLLKDLPLDEYGGIEIVSLETRHEEPIITLQNLSSNNLQLEKLQLIIQEKVSKEFKNLREKYFNGTEKEINPWIEEIKISEEWNTLSSKLKAKIIYEEARIAIDNKQFDKTKILVEEIQSLDSSLYVNRLLSWIEIDNGDLDQAILLLDNSETLTLNQKIAIYLYCQDFKNAKTILDSMAIKDKDYETYRVQAIYEIYFNKNLSNALKNINKSLKLKGNYLEAKRLKSIILFYKATLSTVAPNLITPIVQPNILKIDSKSQDNIKLAIELLNEVIDRNPQYRDILWVNTMLWVFDKEKAIDNIQELYETDYYKEIAIQFILIYNLKIDISKVMILLESEENPQLHNIDKLIRFYFKEKNSDKVFNLLDKYKTVYTKQKLLPNWCEHYVNALVIFNSHQDALDFIEKNNFDRSEEFKASIYENNNDYKSAYEIYEKLFNKTKEPIYRLSICEIKSKENDWKYITKYSDYLLENFQTEKVIELVVYAEYNSKNYSKTQKLIEKWINFINIEEIQDNFQKIKAMCENQSGFPKQAISIMENNCLIKDEQDILTLAHLYQKIGDKDKIEDLIIEHKDNVDININSKLQVASMTNNSLPIIKYILKSENINKSDKELSLLLFQNGIMDDFVMKNIKEMANDKKYPVIMIDVNDFVPLMENIKKQEEYNFDIYQKGKLAIHFLNDLLPRAYLKKNNMPIYIRGAKKFNFINLENTQNNILYLDITSLLLLDSIDLLEQVINNFFIIYLPANIFSNLEELDVSTNLTTRLKTYFKLNQFAFCPEINSDKIKEDEPLSNNLLSLTAMFESNNPKEAIVCIDDRFANNFHHTQYNKQIISTTDILFTFYTKKIIYKDKYYSVLLELRKRNYLYIIMTSQEIIYHLKKCLIENKKLIESEELKALKKLLFFMIQNFKYILPSTKEEVETNQYSESFFVIKQEREIHHSLIDLWNEEFEYEEDRYLCLTWIMDNIVTFNMSYLIRNKLPHNTDITMSINVIGISSLFIQGVTIKSNKNQKLYFDWLYDKYIYNIFIVNSKLFESFLINIKNIVLETFIKKDLKPMEIAIIQNFIMNFPDKIQTFVGSVKEIQEALLMKGVLGIGKVEFIDRNFIEKVTKVINGSQKEFVETIGESIEKFTIKSKIIANKKEIIFYNKNDNAILDRRFFILSTSKKQQKQCLEEHPEWLDMSNSKKESTFNNLNKIQIHYDRFEALDKIIEKSLFYENIENSLKQQKIKFVDLCPTDIDILLNHFRIDDKIPTKNIFSSSMNTLLDEEDIYTTINRASNLPIRFSSNIIEYFNKISYFKQKQLLLQIFKTSRSPISIFHLLRVLLEINSGKFNKIIRFLIKQIFTDKFKLEFQAFISVLNYVRQKFNQRYIDLNNDVKLALIWSHSNQLMKYFIAYNIEPNWINKRFKEQTNMISLEIFQLDNAYNRDILSDNLSYERFIIASLSYAYSNDFTKVQGKYTINKINGLMTFDKNSFNFLRLNIKLQNATNSFLQIEDTTLIDNFKNIKDALVAIDEIISTEKDNNIFLSILSSKYNFEKLNIDEENRLIEYINNYRTNLTEPSEMDFYNVLLIVKQLKNIPDNKLLSKRVIGFIFILSDTIKTEYQASLIIELLIYLSIYRVEELDLRIKLFVKYISMCKKLHKFDSTKILINKSLRELPFKYANYFLLLKYKIL